MKVFSSHEERQMFAVKCGIDMRTVIHRRLVDAGDNGQGFIETREMLDQVMLADAFKVLDELGIA